MFVRGLRKSYGDNEVVRGVDLTVTHGEVFAWLTILVAALGRAAYGVSLPAEHLPAAVITVLLGALSCCAIGCLFTVVIRKATAATPILTAATPILTAVTLMLFFLSGNFFSTDQAPAALRNTAALFPIRHFLTALLTAFNPNVTGAGFATSDLAILAIWGILSAALAARIFRWTPVSES